MVMDKFESQFEDLDVQTEYMEGAMAGTTTMTTPQTEVDGLMQQVADEHGLELNQEFGNFAPGTSIAGLNKQEEKDVEADKLDERLRALRQWSTYCIPSFIISTGLKDKCVFSELQIQYKYI